MHLIGMIACTLYLIISLDMQSRQFDSYIDGHEASQRDVIYNFALHCLFQELNDDYAIAVYT